MYVVGMQCCLVRVGASWLVYVAGMYGERRADGGRRTRTADADGGRRECKLKTKTPHSDVGNKALFSVIILMALLIR